jgi:transposase
MGERVRSIQQIRDLLECVWPAALEAAKWPFRSTTWIAAMTVVMDRDGGDLDRTRRLGAARFEHAVRKEVTRRGKVRPCLRIAHALFAALTDTAGVIAHRPGAFERLAWTLSDWDHARATLADTESRMVAVLDQLELTDLPAPSLGCPRSGPRRSWQRPATCTGSPPRGPWSTHLASAVDGR